MAKVTLGSIGNLVDTTTAANTLNSNNTSISTAMDNTLSRDGTSPNQMLSNLDMNSNHILNLSAPATPNEPVRLADISLLNAGGTINTLPIGGFGGQTLTKNSSSNYDVSWQTPTGGGGGSSSSSLFGGRLTLSSGQPIITTDVSGTNVYYAPYSGKTVPVNSGSGWVNQVFTTSSVDQVGLSLPLNTGWTVGTIHDVFAVMNSGTLTLATRLWDSSMLPSADVNPTVTTPIATGTTGSWIQAGLAGIFNGTFSQNAATCALVISPGAGIFSFAGSDWGAANKKIVKQVVIQGPSNDYFLGNGAGTVLFCIDGSNDNVNWTTLNYGRVDNTVINNNITILVGAKESYRYHRVGIQGNGSNANRIAQIQFTVESPSSTRRLTTFDGILVNDASMTVRGSVGTFIVPQYQGTYLGSLMIDSGVAGQVTCHVNTGPSRVYNLYNKYNQVPVKLRALAWRINPMTSSGAAGYVISNNTWAAMAGDTTNSMSILIGYPEQFVPLSSTRAVFMNASANVQNIVIGIGVDTTSIFTGTLGSWNKDFTGQGDGLQLNTKATLPPFFGVRKATAIEYTSITSGLNTTVWSGQELNSNFEATWMA